MRFEKFNFIISTCVLLLLSTSVLVIFSSSKELALQQFIFSIIGLFIFFFVARVDYRALEAILKPGYLLIIFLLIFVIILGFETRGSTRWIPLGIFNLQPSEFAKPILILCLASFWSKRVPSWKNVFLSLMMILLPALLIFRQPDLGTALTVGALWVGTTFLTNLSFKKILTIVIITMLLLPATWFTLHTYQRQRIVSFLSPASDPLGQGYNVIQSTIAVGSGEFFGRGLGHGTQSRLQFLPEYRTDFIFAAIAEELGFLGAGLLLVILACLVTYCLRVGSQAVDSFGMLICSGVAIMILFQTIVNVGMNLGVLPITGITLPLVSYGGSSMVATLLSLGLVVSVARSRRSVDMFKIGS